jgi:diguanylate cyclase (GGDEF)-like protein
MNGVWDRLAVSLKARVFILTVGIFVAIAAPAYVAFDWCVRSTVVTLGRLFAEKQILFDRYRGLEALMREVSLAETIARSPAVRGWAREEADPAKAARGLAELEHYRLSFRDRSYFFVVHDSGNYYFNDRGDHYAGAQLRYAVSADNPRDGWYFKTVSAGKGCHLNVDRDDNLAVTKVWINCVIAEQDRILGVIGTGVDLSEFIHEVVALPQTGVTSMFVDRSGAIQAHRDPSLVDFHSLTKDTKSKKTIFRQIDNEADATALADMMARLADGTHTVESRFMRIGGREILVGVGYLDRLGWFNVTLMDVEAIIDRRLFTPIAILLTTMMAAAAALVTLLFRRSVLDRLADLEASAYRVEQGDFSTILVDFGRDEIGRLSRAFAAMATAVHNYTGSLEEMVDERTEKLRRVADIDLLTDIPNRRGFIRAFEETHANAAVTGATPALLLIDLDGFKAINDSRGHQAGDRLLAETAQRLSSLLGPDDVCARWGGDEFVVLMADCEQDRLRDVCARMLGTINAGPVRYEDGGSDVVMTVSIGACGVAADDTLDAAVARADAALYAAKRAGRNRFVVSGAVADPAPQAGCPVSA